MNTTIAAISDDDRLRQPSERLIVKILLAGGLVALSAFLGGCAVVPAYPTDVGVSAGVYVNQPVMVAPVYGYAYPRYRHHRHHRHYR
jgi:hypothetical protein